jgi:hypothetical protein
MCPRIFFQHPAEGEEVQHQVARMMIILDPVVVFDERHFPVRVAIPERVAALGERPLFMNIVIRFDE